MWIESRDGSGEPQGARRRVRHRRIVVASVHAQRGRIGLPVLICAGVHEAFADGDEVAIDLAAGTITSGDGERTLQGEALPTEMRDILDAGGILALLDSQTAG